VPVSAERDEVIDAIRGHRIGLMRLLREHRATFQHDDRTVIVRAVTELNSLEHRMRGES
jgi:hypothetical protein